MKTINYSPDGVAFPDHYAERAARQFLLGELKVAGGTDDTIAVSTDNFVLAARALVVEGVVPHTDVAFAFKGEVLPHDKDARFPVWPNGFCDWSQDWLMRLIKPRQ